MADSEHLPPKTLLAHTRTVLVEDGWRKGALGSPRRGVPHCAVGALAAAYADLTALDTSSPMLLRDTIFGRTEQARHLLDLAARHCAEPLGIWMFTDEDVSPAVLYNDHPYTRLPDILRMVDEAIAAAKGVEHAMG